MAAPSPASSPSSSPSPDRGPTVAEFDEHDSTYDEEAISTASITSSIYAYETEHGRTYHAYKAGKYVLPNDEDEKDRMDVQYHALRILFDDKLIFAPVENLQLVIDIGTGTVIWCMDFGEKYPSARVLGTDLSPIQPPFVPPNVEFEIHDCTDMPWGYAPNSADLIHTRITNGFAVRNWDEFYAESYRCLKPGSFIESQEFDLMAFSVDDSLPPSSAITQWCELMNEGALKGGMQLRLKASVLEAAMKNAGFEDVTVHEFKLPIGLWPREPQLQEAGKYALFAMLEGLQGISLAIFTRLLGWDVLEMEVLIAKVRKEWLMKRVKSYWPIFVVYGRKPI